MDLAAQLNDPAYLASLLRHGGDPNALEVYGYRTVINEAIMLSRMENVTVAGRGRGPTSTRGR